MLIKLAQSQNRKLKASYPNGFINSVINNFHQRKEDFLIQSTLFEEQKEINFQALFCKRNDEKMKQILCTLEEYTNLSIQGKLENYDPFSQ